MENRPAFTQAFGTAFQEKLEKAYASLTSPNNDHSERSFDIYVGNRNAGFGFNPIPLLEEAHFLKLKAGRQVNKLAVAGLNLFRAGSTPVEQNGL